MEILPSSSFSGNTCSIAFKVDAGDLKEAQHEHTEYDWTSAYSETTSLDLTGIPYWI